MILKMWFWQVTGFDYFAVIIIKHNLFLQPLTVTQIKSVRVEIDNQMKENVASLLKEETSRNDALKEIGNILHESCIVSNDEVDYFKNFNFKNVIWSIIKEFLSL